MGIYDFTVYDLIVRNARTFAKREAWVFGQRRASFELFINEVNDLSIGLQKSGLVKGDRIGVLSQNCYEFVLLYGAAAQIGGGHAPD